jgi:endonuclease-3
MGMNAEQLQQFFACLQADNPTPTTELNYRNAFELLISVILSAQATDKSVNKATAELFNIAPTPQAMLALGEEGLKQYIKQIGLFNSKARNIIKTCADLLEKHQGEVPQEREALENLAGVGRKTANVILNTAFGQPTIAVDTHIFRVANRTGLAQGKNVRAVEEQLLAVVPEIYRQDAHHWLILLGRYTCTARKPHCGQCIVRQFCVYPDKTSSVTI